MDQAQLGEFFGQGICNELMAADSRVYVIDHPLPVGESAATLCGKERVGIEHWRASLFHHAVNDLLHRLQHPQRANIDLFSFDECVAGFGKAAQLIKATAYLVMHLGILIVDRRSFLQ